MYDQIKNTLKTNILTKLIYTKLQCFLILLQYQTIKIIYSIRKSPYINEVPTSNMESSKVNIFYLGTDEFQDKSGFLQALGKLTHVTYFTKEDGSYGTYNFGVLNRKKNIEMNKQRLFELFSELDVVPDVLLMQTWEWRIGLKTLIELKTKYPKIKIVNISMDDRHSFWIYGFKKYGSAGLIPALDYVMTTSSEFVNFYEKEGCKAFFYPLASDNKVFKDLEIEKKYDVGFVGAKYGIREEIVNGLISNGIEVKAYGNGWENGRLPLEDTNKFYNQCKIVLGIGTILGCDNFVSMKLRDFDVPMSGSTYVTNYNSDTAKIFIEGEEIVYYKNKIDCIDKIKKLLSNEDAMNKIRQNALIKAKEQTYDKRIGSLLNNIGYKL